MDDGSSRVDHEVGHGTLARLLEAVDVVRNAHLVPASLAVPTSEMENRKPSITINVKTALLGFNLPNLHS